MNPVNKMTGLQKITLQIRTKGGMVVDADTAPAAQLEIAQKEGWIITHESTGKTWVWIETLL